MGQRGRVASVIAVGAGKGGVGKSMVTVNLAHTLAAKGARVGIIDADIYGPSIGNMIQSDSDIKEDKGWIVPAYGLGIHFVSLAHFALGQEATIVRAPIANQIITEFLENVAWPDLDYLLIDFPPGTGDIGLTIMQKSQLSGAIVVSTGQKVALLDVAKAVAMFEKMQVPILGVIENMSYQTTPMGKIFPFGASSIDSFCYEKNLPLIGKVPLNSELSIALDQGRCCFNHEHEIKETFHLIVEQIEAQLLKLGQNRAHVCKSFDLNWE